MALITDGYTKTFETEFDVPYMGIYSKFISKIIFRCQYDMVTEYGIVIKSEYTRYGSYSLIRILKEQCHPIDVYSLLLDNMIYNVLVHELSNSDLFITESDLVMCKVVSERNEKLSKLKAQIKKEKSIPFKLKKFFKLK